MLAAVRRTKRIHPRDCCSTRDSGHDPSGTRGRSPVLQLMTSLTVTGWYLRRPAGSEPVSHLLASNQHGQQERSPPASEEDVPCSSRPPHSPGNGGCWEKFGAAALLPERGRWVLLQTWSLALFAGIHPLEASKGSDQRTGEVGGLHQRLSSWRI